MAGGGGFIERVISRSKVGEIALDVAVRACTADCFEPDTVVHFH